MDRIRRPLLIRPSSASRVKAELIHATHSKRTQVARGSRLCSVYLWIHSSSNHRFLKNAIRQSSVVAPAAPGRSPFHRFVRIGLGGTRLRPSEAAIRTGRLRSGSGRKVRQALQTSAFFGPGEVPRDRDGQQQDAQQLQARRLRCRLPQRRALVQLRLAGRVAVPAGVAIDPGERQPAYAPAAAAALRLPMPLPRHCRCSRTTTAS